MEKHIPTLIKLWRAIYNLQALYHWKKLIGILVTNLTTPFQHPVFVFYFTFFILGIGGTGVWFEMLNDSTSQVTQETRQTSILFAIATYSLTLSAASLAELYLPKKEGSETIKPETKFIYLCFAIIPIAGSLYTLYRGPTDYQSIQVSTSLSALLLWWMIYSNNESFIIDPRPENALGHGDAKPISRVEMPDNDGGLILE